MLEASLKKARDEIVRKRAKYFGWGRVIPPAVWIIVAVVICMGGRWLWLKAHRVEHTQEIAAAFGSASLLNAPAQFSHNLAYCTYTAFADTRGVSLYLRETGTGQKRQVAFQADGAGPFLDLFDLQAQPWSPDDRSFIYSTKGSLFVCPAETNLPADELKLGTDTIPSSVIWLNPSEFVWLEDKTICHAKKPADGSWAVQRFDSHAEILGLTAIGLHKIAWLQDNCICRLDFSQDLTGTNNPFNSSTTANTAPVTNNLVLWLDASLLRQTDQTPVTALDDRSQAHNTAAVSDGAPVYNAPENPGALNGKGTIHFTSNAGLRTSKPPGLAGASPRTVFVVMRRDIGRQMLVNMGQPGVRGAYFGICDRQNGLALPAGWVADNNIPVEPRRWNILEVVYDGKEVKGYVNGSLKAERKVALNTIDRSVEIGLRSGTNAAAGSDGDFAELLVYNRVLDSGERQQVENYLNAKWFNVRQFSHESPIVWLDPYLDHLTGFGYSPETGRFLIRRTENGHDTLWRVDTDNGSPGKPTPVSQGRLLVDMQMQWVGSNTMAFTSGKAGSRGLFLADLSSEQSSPLFQHEDIRWFQVAPNHEGILIEAALSNEPAMGIWRYDLDSKQLHSIVPASDQPSAFAKKTKTFTATIRLQSGQTADCTVFLPANFDPRKKYPLVLGDTYTPDPIYGQRLESGIAASGAIVAFVNRKTWGADIEKWEDNVRSLYEYLRRDPCIDTKRVYLISASAETEYMSRTLEKFPGLWKGAIFLNPSRLPDFSKSPLLQSRPRILISAGGEEGGAERFKTYQQNGLQSGVLMEYVIHPGEAHRLVGKVSTQARLEAIAHFLFEE